MDIQKAKERIDKEYRNRLFEPLQEKWRVLRPGEGCWLTAAWITDHLGLPTCPLSECLLGVCMYNTDDVLKIFDWIDNFAHEHGYYDEFYKVRLDQIQEEEAAHYGEAMKILAQIAGMPEGYSANTYTKKIIWGNEKGEQSMHPHDEPMFTLNFDIPTLGSTLGEEQGENCMKYQLKRDLTMSFTAENAEVNQDMIDQLVVNEIISEVVDATNKIFNEHLKKHGISATSIRSDSIIADVRKRLYDDLKPIVEYKMKRETKTFNIGALARHPSLTANRIYQYDGRHTTVEWADGTKTTVCCEDPEKYTEWGGFCACVAKKLYGSTTKAEDMLENAKEYTAWPKKKKEIERKKIKRMCRNRHNRAVDEREKKIAAKMEEMRITNEAGHRLAKEDSEKETAVAVEEK